jgi:hypothetical protein
MSRGFGKTQRAILTMLAEHDRKEREREENAPEREEFKFIWRWLPIRCLAAWVYEVPFKDVTKRQRDLLHRSLRKLAAIGLIYQDSAYGRSRWTSSRELALEYWRHRPFAAWPTDATDDEILEIVRKHIACEIGKSELRAS